MGLSFLKGLVASVNPCAFVLLPTYLAFFLGTGGGAADRPVGDARATVRRALVVAGSVSAGFMAVFVTVGLLSEYVTRWVEEHARWFTLVVGVVFVVGGVAMLTGRRLPWSTPRVALPTTTGSGRRTVVSMALYGVAYAVTSISCTLPLFVTTMIGNGRRSGFGSGVAHVAAYGAGMALVVTSLTIAIALARTGLVATLRRGSRHVDRIAAVLVVVSGLYLLHYVWTVELAEGSSPVSDAVSRVQQRVQVALNDHWQVVAAALAAVVVAATWFAAGRRSPDRSG